MICIVRVNSPVLAFHILIFTSSLELLYLNKFLKYSPGIFSNISLFANNLRLFVESLVINIKSICSKIMAKVSIILSYYKVFGIYFLILMAFFIFLVKLVWQVLIKFPFVIFRILIVVPLVMIYLLFDEQCTPLIWSSCPFQDRINSPVNGFQMWIFPHFKNICKCEAFKIYYIF